MDFGLIHYYTLGHYVATRCIHLPSYFSGTPLIFLDFIDVCL